MGTSIAACIPILNDVEAIRVTLPYTKRWADEVVIVDSGSTDGTLEFLKWFLEPCDKLIHLPIKEALQMGWDIPRNMAAESAQSEWVFSMDADCFLKPNNAALLKSELEKDGNVIQVSRLNIVASAFTLWQTEQAIENTACEPEPKDWIYRRTCGARYCGYVHEELYIAGERAIGRRIEADVYHLTRIRPANKRNAMLAGTFYRMKRTLTHPELRFALNPYWYELYYSKNKQLADRLAHDYAQEHGLPED